MLHTGSIGMRSIVVRLLLALALGAAASGAAAQDTGKRVALIVGNSNYRSIERLANPANDARLVAQSLAGLGFELIGNGPQLDLDKAAFEAALEGFRAAAAGSEIALFYYAGHGVQIGGVNWLVPVSAAVRSEADVASQMIDANRVLTHMKAARAALNVVILDACRNNPFLDPPADAPVAGRQLGTPAPPAGGTAVLTRAAGGLGRMDAPDNTVISYATQPGNVALDGKDGNSPYSRSFAAAVLKPGREVRQTLNDVGVQVKQLTSGAQQPWISASPIDKSFYFAGRPANEASQPAAPELLWVLGTWQGRLESFPKEWEPHRSYAVANVNGELVCYWQQKGAPQQRTNCEITANGISTTTRGNSSVRLRRASDALTGTMRLVATNAEYKLTLRRVSPAVVSWLGGSDNSKLGAHNGWATGTWTGMVEGLKSNQPGRELKIESAGDALKCSWRAVGPNERLSPAPCQVTEKGLTLVTSAGTDVELTRNGTMLEGSFKTRNGRTYRVSLRKS